MKVNMGGHTPNGKRIHAVVGEWSYTSNNMSWCGTTLTGNDHKMMGNVEVTCKRCIKQTPTYSHEHRKAAFEYVQAWRANFDLGFRGRALRDVFPGWQGDLITLAKIVLSGALPE